jgi:hypothetical protein
MALASRAMRATAARSVIFISGFDGVSIINRVAGRTAARTAAGSVLSTWLVSSGRGENGSDQLCRPVHVLRREDVVAGSGPGASAVYASLMRRPALLFHLRAQPGILRATALSVPSRE